jgi:mRNA interferase RelE/StbE
MGRRAGSTGVKYQVYVMPEAWNELKDLPGNVRQRVRAVINSLEADPRQSNSKQLTATSRDWELRRVRLDKWRVIYGINDEELKVDVLAVRKRPPYDYGNLETLLGELE